MESAISTKADILSSVNGLTDRYQKEIKYLEVSNLLVLPENDGEIIYRDGWKQTGRIPTIYDYSGFCIITIKPADDTAMLLEFDRANHEKMGTLENEFDFVFGAATNTAQKNTEYDNVFLDLLVERNTVDESEFDNIFGDESKTEKQVETEFDDILDF